MARRMRSLLPLAAALALTSCKPMGMQAKQYSGDGTLRTCSKLIGQGYAIELAPFDATKPYLASYRLSHVPQVHRDPVVYLRFHSGPSVSFPEDLKEARDRHDLGHSRGQVRQRAAFSRSAAVLRRLGGVSGYCSALTPPSKASFTLGPRKVTS